jgi:predicted PurR-regulated permease PerM
LQYQKLDSSPAKRVVRFELTLSTMISMMLVIVGLWMLIKLVPVILVLITSLIIVGTLSPTVSYLETKGMHRGWSIALVFSTLLVVTGLIIILTVPEFLLQVSSLIDQEPVLRAQLVVKLAASPLTSSLAETLRNLQYGAVIQSFGATAFTLTAKILEVFAYGIGSIFLALYIMIDRDRLRGGLYSIVPRTHHIRLSRVMMNLEMIVGGYIRGQIITCVMMAVFIFILLEACGVKNALAIAIFGGVADVLPYIGIFLTMGPAVMAATAQGPVIVMVVFILMLVYEELESRVLVPLVYGNAMRIPSSIVFFSLIVGATLLGVMGALLALPIAAAMLMLIEELRVSLPGETVNIENENLRKKDDRGEQEYERRTEGMPAEKAAAIAVEMSDDRKKEEDGPQMPSKEKENLL